MNRWVVILAGGIGSRFWPLSTPSHPKQLLALTEDKPMLAATLARLGPSFPLERTLVLTSELLVDATLRTVPELSRSNILAEPRAAGTAAALAWAALRIAERDSPNAIMVSVHADWFVRDEQGFRDVLQRAGDVATRHDSLVTVGIVPTRAETGFGYIQPGDPVEGSSSATKVERFIEKPDRDNAARMCAAGYFWNSGIFAWRAGRLLDEIRAHTPEVATALDKSQTAAEFFAAVKPVSVDVGVLERSDRVMVLAGNFGWDDVGTWGALSRVLPLDANGNAVRGPATLVSSENNVVYSADSRVVLFGVSDLVVVCTSGVTLVTTREEAADLKRLLDSLPPTGT